MPPSRTFAAELGVARSTITAAYEQLAAEGYVGGRRGAGVFVADLPDTTLTVSPPGSSGVERAVADHSRTSILPFRPGAPDLRLFPHARWARLAALASRNGAAILADDDPMGSLRLRRAISTHLAEWRGLLADPERIAITAGASGALELALDAFTRTGDLVAVENPGYPVMPHLILGRGRRLELAAVDHEGISLESLRAAPDVRMAIATPSHQFPLGGALSIGRRRELLQWSADTGAVLVEDDYDSEFRYTGRPLPALAAAGAPVAYIGTFSKVFWTGLRIGFLVVPEALAEPLRAAAVRFGQRASVMPQAPLAAFIESGEFARHLRRMRRTYRERMRLLRRLIVEVLGPDLLIPEERAAGLHLLARLGPALAAHMEDAEAASRAQAAGVTVAPLSRYYHAPPAGQGLVFGFAAFEEEEMVRAMKRLREALG